MNFDDDINNVSISKVITAFLQNLNREDFSVHELVSELKERSFGILMLLIAIPNAFLIASVPLTSIVFGLGLIFVSFQIILRFPEIILPKKIRQKTFSKKQLSYILNIYSFHLIFIEKYLKSRWSFLITGVWETILGIICLLLGIVITLPIPMGNFLSGIALIFISLGVIGKDGLFIIIGYFLSAVIFTFVFSSSIFLYSAVQYIYVYVQQLLF